MHILKERRHIKNQTPSIDAHLLAEQSHKISSRSVSKLWSFSLFKERPHQKNKSKMSSYMESVAGPNIRAKSISRALIYATAFW